MNNVVSIAEILSSAGSVPLFTCVFSAELFHKSHFAFSSTFARANTSHDSRSVVTKSKIESSTVDSPRGEGGRAVQKRRLQIWIARGPKFEEHRAEVRALKLNFASLAAARLLFCSAFTPASDCCQRGSQSRKRRCQEVISLRSSIEARAQHE